MKRLTVQLIFLQGRGDDGPCSTALSFFRDRHKCSGDIQPASVGSRSVAYREILNAIFGPSSEFRIRTFHSEYLAHVEFFDFGAASQALYNV